MSSSDTEKRATQTGETDSGGNASVAQTGALGKDHEDSGSRVWPCANSDGQLVKLTE